MESKNSFRLEIIIAVHSDPIAYPDESQGNF